jgi:hypothetical protein
MANNTIQLVIAAKNEASATLNQVKKDLDKINSTNKKDVSGGKGFLGGYGTPAAILATGAAITMAAKAASESAAAFDRLKVGTDALGKQYGLSATSILTAVDSVTQGTLSQSAILQQSNQAMLLGVANTADEFETLAKIAVDRGRKMGIDMEKAFSSIVLGVGRLSPLILDNLGIVIDADNTYKAYAETLGKTASTLTDMEKRQALLSRLKGEMTDFDASGVLDAASAWERMSAAFADSTVVIGDWINKSTPFLDVVRDLTTNLQTNALVLFGNDDIDKLKLINIQLSESKRRVADLQAAQAKQFKDLGGKQAEGASLKWQLGVALMISEETARQVELEQQKQDIIAATTAIAQDMTEAQKALAQAEADQAREDFNKATAQEKLNSLMGEYGKLMGLTKSETAAMGDALIAAGGSIDAAVAKAQNLVGALSAAAAQAAAVTSAMGGAYGALQSAAVEAYRNSGYSADVLQAYDAQLGYLKNVEQTLIDSGAAEQHLAFYAAEAADAATEGFDAYNKQFETITKSAGGAKQLTEEFRNLQSTVSGIFSDMFSDIGGVKVEDFLPREDAPNEAARRIADVMIKGFESPWADYFKTSFPDLFEQYMGQSGGDVKNAAALLLKDFQSGLRPELIDTNVVKELAKRAFQVDQSTKAMIDQISRELADELGISIEEATGYASGAAGGAGLISKEAITKTNSELKFKPQFDMSNTKNDLISAGKSAGLLDEAGQILIEATVKISSVDIDTSTLGVVGIPTVPIVTGTPTTNAQKVLDMIGTVSAPVYLDYTKINGSPDAATNIETLIGRVETPVYLGVPTTESVQTWVNNIVAQVGSIGIPVTATPPADLSVVGPAFSPVYTEIHNALTARVPFTATDILSILSQTFADNVTQTQMMGLNLGINMYQGFAQYPLGAVLASELSRQVDEAQKSFENSGKNAGRKWGGAFLEVVGENVPIELLNILTDLITPEVQARLTNEGTR